jgi:hypothetical protein
MLERAKDSSGLYSDTGSPEFDSALRSLSLMARDSFEWPFRVAAVAMAYCIQMGSLSRMSRNA